MYVHLYPHISLHLKYIYMHFVTHIFLYLYSRRDTVEGVRAGTCLPLPQDTTAKVKEMSVQQVFELVDSIGFSEAAQVLKKCNVDGETLCDPDADEFFTLSIAQGGLGLTGLQKIRLKKEIAKRT